MASLPTEIIYQEILPKLPIKTLMRFKCVSTSYNTLISSPHFADLHLAESISSDSDRALILAGVDYSNKLCSVDVEAPDSIGKKPVSLTPQEWFQGYCSIVGSSNGLVCVGPTFFNGFFELKHVVINPFTRMYRIFQHIQSPNLQSASQLSFGFGFDDVNHDYKLVRIVENHDEREVMVHRMRDNSWKLVEDVGKPLHIAERFQNGVRMRNDLLHWVCKGLDEEDRYQICCFDVQAEKWAKDVPLMKISDSVVRELSIGVLNDYLCLSTSTWSTSKNDFYQAVWIMKTYGDKGSWVKLYNNPIFSVGHSFFQNNGPFGFRQGCTHKVLIRTEFSNRLCWCDIESEELVGSGDWVEREVIEGIPTCMEACFLKGSMVPIPGGQRIHPQSEITHD